MESELVFFRLILVFMLVAVLGLAGMFAGMLLQSETAWSLGNAVAGAGAISAMLAVLVLNFRSVWDD
jgi:hypothetical protein